ncbi:DinB family protein [Salinimicrobium xinjiangense]|uniref:DinB family protein n=1 Tax=Salinimicrobium xinjiangense TaxID=438596 RepID=UPI000414C727|nr:DinB family protein [Salinimicrobium xinjiangense]
MAKEDIIKKQLEKQLFGGEAFMPVDEMLKKISFTQVHIRPKGLPYSFYELFFHMWFTQKDILGYCTNSSYSSPSWPDDYWPKKVAPAREPEWIELQKAFFEDREKLSRLILSEDTALNDPVPSNEEHTIFREILLVIEHTSYHSGQLLIILRHLGLHSS